MTLDAAFTNFPVLTTERLRLREPRAEDAEAIFEFKSDPEVTRPYAVEPYRALEQSAAWVRGRLDDYRRRDGLVWIVVAAGDDRAIGSVCFWHFEPGFRTAELGYELRRSHWGRGIATEAAGAAVGFGFTEMEFHRIEACPLAENVASHRLLEHLGFTLEGTLRERVARPDRFEDQLYYGLLRDRWRDPRPAAQRER
jgi:[ribosomal protein S5]-alanine N-acetyltransferase